MNARKDYQREMKSHNMSAGMDMQMTFNSKLPLSLLFEEIELQNSKDLVVACVLLFLLGALYEGIKKIRLKLNDPHCKISFCCSCSGKRISLFHSKENPQSEVETECNSSLVSALTNSSKIENNVKVAVKRTRNIHPTLIHIIQTGLHALQLIISYLIMLAVMTYNAFIVTSIIAGCTAGYFLLEWPSQNRKSSDHRRELAVQETGCH